MSTLFVPISTLPAEDWEPHTSASIPGDISGLALPQWVGQASPAFTFSSDKWDAIPDPSNFEFVLIEEDEGLITEKSLSFRFNAAEFVERLQSMPEVFSERERIGCALQSLEDQIQKDLRLLRCQAAPVISLSKRENGGLIIFINAIIVLTDHGIDFSPEGEFADPIDALLAGQQVCLSAGVEVEGRGLKEIAGAVALSVLATFPAAMQAAPGLTSAPTDAIVEVAPSDLEVVKTARKLVNQKPLMADYSLLERAKTEGSRVIVDVSDQRARLYVGDSIALDTPISTARRGKHTTRGTFQITQKVQTGKRSTIYGCALPFWMRLGETPIGMHVGELPGYPASAGCVRLPAEAAQLIFASTERGTPVTIRD